MPPTPDTNLTHQDSDRAGECGTGVSVDRSLSSIFQTFSGTEPTDSELASIAPISLAYIGDAVFELYVRSQLLIPAKRLRDYHEQVVAQVKTEQQAHYVDVLTPYLTEAEKDVMRRGRNATSGRNRRANAQDYQKATGFEALIGFLYISDQARLFNLLNQLSVNANASV
ncbi:MAG: ribonuclease III domain-containing protein [Cyanobacteria bacterium J06649_5]